jgi:hypothetical protein
MVKSYASAVCIVKLTWTSCCRTIEGSPVPRLCPGDWALPRGRLGWGLRGAHYLAVQAHPRSLASSALSAAFIGTCCFGPNLPRPVYVKTAKSCSPALNGLSPQIQAFPIQAQFFQSPSASFYSANHRDGWLREGRCQPGGLPTGACPMLIST